MAFITDIMGEFGELTGVSQSLLRHHREGRVRLSTQLERFNEIYRKTSAELKAAEAALAEDQPVDMGLDEFFAFAPNTDTISGSRTPNAL